MISGKKISPLTALRYFGCLRLSARIFELIDYGITIEKCMVNEKDKHYMQYWIRKETCEGYRKHKLLQA
jgi:hypothetical protein